MIYYAITDDHLVLGFSVGNSFFNNSLKNVAIRSIVGGDFPGQKLRLICTLFVHVVRYYGQLSAITM